MPTDTPAAHGTRRAPHRTRLLRPGRPARTGPGTCRRGAAGEALGLGSVFLSERFDKKEIGVLSRSGRRASATDLTIVTAATNHNTRHPMITAGLARTMQSLTGGRFVLGLGRGIPVIQDTYGIPRITTAALEDFAGHHAPALPAASPIVGHDGPAGSWPVLYLAAIDEDLPLGLVAFGPHILALGGRASTRSSCTRSSPRRPPGGAWPTVSRPPSGPAGIPAPCRSGRAWPPSATTSRRGPALHEVGRAPGHVSPGLRRPPRGHQRLGPGRARPLPGRSRRCPASSGASTPTPRPTSWSTSPR